MARLSLVLAPLFLSLWLLLLPRGPGLVLPVQAPPAPLEEVYARAHPAAVAVEGEAGARGSGFFLQSAQGPLVLTAYHVVAEGGRLFVRTARGERKEARLLGYLEPLDLALLRTEAEAPLALEPELDRPLRPGEELLAIGNARGEFISPRFGRLVRSGVEVSPFLPSSLLETTLPLAPGDSGGPVLDAYGRVVGVAVAIGVTEEGFRSYATPLVGRREELGRLERGERVSWPYLGLRGPRALTPDLAQELGLPPGGVLVGQVVPGGAAHRAGLRGLEAGGVPDVILEVDGLPVNTFEELLRAVRRKQVGEEVELLVRRGEEVFRVRVGLQPFPGRP
ncbi:S1C family serine protease [Thermus filiformis]|uniref:Serine protease n=1 Tax=Thermus filiformis TaxID=276 RepID=A0A0A2WNI0_THEFI|nr:trypsin-like peptidase domain-containing protein [Thermus filiformis]KGQ21706.1 serine protease [Thermus filiformis]